MMVLVLGMKVWVSVPGAVGSHWRCEAGGGMTLLAPRGTPSGCREQERGASTGPSQRLWVSSHPLPPLSRIAGLWLWEGALPGLSVLPGGSLQTLVPLLILTRGRFKREWGLRDP